MRSFRSTWCLSHGRPYVLPFSQNIFYFDPDEHRRGLGTYGAIREIAFAREGAIPYYYLGYWIEPCRSMRYKAEFRPFELLHPDGQWRRGGDGVAGMD